MITQYMHCKKCLKQIPDGVSPRDYARLEAGITKEGFQVRCVRHEMNVYHIDLLGQKVEYAKGD